MFSKMSEPCFKDFHMVIAFGKRRRIGSELIPLFTDENQLLF